MVIENKFLSACAGSGKTYALTQRLISLLKAGAHPGEILAITFTRKATAEIKMRVLAALQEKKNEAWARQCYRRILLAAEEKDRLNIYTFHSWFSSLQAKPIPLTLIEDQNSFKKEIWLRWLKTLAEDEKGLSVVLSYCTPHSLQSMLEAGLGQIQAWKQIRNLELSETTKPSNEPLYAEIGHFLNHAQGRESTFLNFQKASIQFLEQEIDFQTWLKTLFTDKKTVRDRLQKSAEKNNYSDSLQAVVNAANVLANALDAEAMQIFDQASKNCFTRYVDVMEKIKAENQWLTFDDLEYDTFRLFCEEEKIASLFYNLHLRYRHLLIDEFQDTSPLQWHIIRQWLHSTHGTENAPSAFIVGDEKQAIFRFRNGDVRLMKVACDFLKTHYHAKQEYLDFCYRQAPPILEFVNALFAPVFEDYPHHHAKSKALGRVEWHPPLKSERAPKSVAWRNPLTTPVSEKEDYREHWSVRIAKRLHDMIGHWQLDDGRVCDANDVLILLPKLTHASTLVSAIQKQGIPCFCNKTDVFQSFVYSDIQALLTVMQNRQNSLSLAQVLKSPLIGLSDEMLNLIGTTAHGSLWNRLSFCKHPQAISARQKCERWYQQLDKGQTTIHDWLSQLWAEVRTPYRRFVVAVNRPQLDQEMNALLDFAVEYDGGRKPLLYEFLQALQERSPPPINGNGVRIMSVHAAKGLEAPIVVVADLSFGEAYSRSQSQSYDILIDWPVEKVQPHSFIFCPRSLKSAAKTLHQQEQKMKERENDNLLYVALTRPKQILLIFCQQPPKTSSTQKISEVMEKYGQQQQDYWFIGDDFKVQNTSPPARLLKPPMEAECLAVGEAYHTTEASKQGDLFHSVMALLLSGVAADVIPHYLSGTSKALINKAHRWLATPALKELMQAAQECLVEAEFVHDGQVLRLDLVVIHPEEIHIVDYKTGNAPVLQHSPQLQKYQDVIAQCYRHHRIRLAILNKDGLTYI